MIEELLDPPMARDSKVPRSYSLLESTHRRIAAEAASKRLSASQAMEEAAQLWLRLQEHGPVVAAQIGQTIEHMIQEESGGGKAL